MSAVRIIARLDIKGPNLIKGIRLEGLRVIGSPHAYAKRYYDQGADELLYMDCVASLYNRNNLSDIVYQATKDVFIPITVGGGIRNVDHVTELLRSGADKVAINTAAIGDPGLITAIAERFGSQCMVLSVEAKSTGSGKWEAFTNNGRDRTGRDVADWIEQAVSLGAGEVLLTSVDREGTRKGFDVELVREITSRVNVPIIASGGLGIERHLVEVVEFGADAVAVADILHYGRATIGDLRQVALDSSISVRRVLND